MKEERFLHPGKPLHWQGDQLGQKGSFRGLQESAAAGLQQAEQMEACTNGPCHRPALPSLRCAFAFVYGGWVLKLGLQRTDPGRGRGLAARRQPEGAGLWLRPAREVKHHR